MVEKSMTIRLVFCYLNTLEIHGHYFDLFILLKVIGINKEATQKEIKRACKDLMRLWHPDKFLVKIFFS